MKTVFNSDEVCHIWISESQISGRNGSGTVYFDRDTIYSYGSHFPIAKIVRNPDKERAVLFTTRDYSTTTARHKGLVRYAIPDYVPVFKVINMGPNHADNLGDYKVRIKELLSKSKNASLNALSYLEQAHDICGELNRYIEFYDLGAEPYTIPDYDNLYEQAKVKSVNAEQKREVRNRVRRAKQEQYHTEAKARFGAELEKWKSGEISTLPGYQRYDFDTCLRVNPDDSGEVQTSLGATVPREHAKRLYRFICEVMKSGKEWVSNGHTFHIGVYKVDRIEVDGTLHAGCHTIEWNEIVRIGEIL